MDKRIKARWVKALRSGKYKKAIGALKVVDIQTGKASYCCLGVLCDLHSKSAKGEKWAGEADCHYHGNDMLLPCVVQDWAKLDDLSSEVKGVELTDFNDHQGYSFKKIATLIEKYL